jgi:hypothetical protein
MRNFKFQISNEKFKIVDGSAFFIFHLKFEILNFDGAVA